ncbi:hypothetical protein F5X68DRAFT_174832 [Plectosphaerella plurivora]|uniref:Zn(2)-C6 fungal-type domain-containing protein n=1 Tax=Plectosphaerella plurivora TaxID=936078 RepID=A0A9P8V4L6_9PEZI|nr:hypothetical protein F5X68DRAFT_174832 [Plectosphaerella plurivora]
MRIANMDGDTPSADSSTASRRRTRRPHQKSREGCVQCKDRHVKCNEQHPQCRSCQKMDLRCSFSAPVPVPASMPLNPDSLMDLELLQYCHRRPGPGHDSVNLGFTHHYLLNSILSLAALQLHREAPSRDKWYARAVGHQQAALARARPHLTKLDASQRQALVAFSAFTSVYTVAEPLARPGRIAHTQPAFDAIKEIVHSCRLARSSRAFVQQNLAEEVAADAYLTYKYGKRQRVVPDGLDEQFPQLVDLRALIDKHAPSERREVCIDAATIVFTGVAKIQSDGRQMLPGAAWEWTIGVDDSFLELCIEENPAALVILAHYGALMTMEGDAWFLRKWPTVLVNYISRRLGDGWKEMEWPRSVVFGSSLEIPSPEHTPASDTRTGISV